MLFQICLIAGFLPTVVLLIHHVRMIDALFRLQNLNLVQSLLLLQNVLGFHLVTKEQFDLVLLILLKLRQFFLFRHHKYFLENLLVLLDAFRRERSICLCGFLMMCKAHCFGILALLLLVFLQKTLVDVIYTFLLLVVLGDFLWTNYLRKFINHKLALFAAILLYIIREILFCLRSEQSPSKSTRAAKRSLLFKRSCVLIWGWILHLVELFPRFGHHGVTFIYWLIFKKFSRSSLFSNRSVNFIDRPRFQIEFVTHL